MCECLKAMEERLAASAAEAEQREYERREQRRRERHLRYMRPPTPIVGRAYRGPESRRR